MRTVAIRWTAACTAAATLAASLSYVSIGAGFARFLMVGVIAGSLQALALGHVIPSRLRWLFTTVVGLVLGIVASLGTTIAWAAIFGVENGNRGVVGAIGFAISSALAGLVAGVIQGSALPPTRRMWPWLLANALATWILVPTIAISFFSGEATTSGTMFAPVWVLGGLSGLAFGLITSAGLVGALRDRLGVDLPAVGA